jgi:predicted nucleotidyltransferase
MTLLDELRKNREKILQIANDCGLKDVRVFGSVARGQERADSDIDILVHYGADASLMKHAGFMVALEEMLKRKVDVVEDKRLHWVIKDDVLREAIPL